jgi:hypothetical protein
VMSKFFCKTINSGQKKCLWLSTSSTAKSLYPNWTQFLCISWHSSSFWNVLPFYDHISSSFSLRKCVCVSPLCSHSVPYSLTHSLSWCSPYARRCPVP